MLRTSVVAGSILLPPLLLLAESAWRRWAKGRVNSTAVYSAEPARGWLARGGLSPFLCIAFVAAPVLAGSGVLEHLGLADAKGDPVGIAGLFAFLTIPFALTGLVVLAWVRFVERRSLATVGMARAGGWPALLRGHAIGLATSLALVVAIWTAGGYTPAGFARALGSPAALANIGILLGCFVLQAGVEEILFRGWLLSLVARRLDVVTAVVITSVGFSLLHYSPHQHWRVMLSSFLFSAFTCCWALQAGNIWGVIGWHAGWNWLLAVGFELPITGLDAGLPALLVRLAPQGPDRLTGGSQGPEGSLFCSLFFAGAIALLAWRRGRRRARSRRSPA